MKHVVCIVLNKILEALHLGGVQVRMDGHSDGYLEGRRDGYREGDDAGYREASRLRNGE